VVQGIEAAHWIICAQLDDSRPQSLRLVPSIHDASCEWSDTGKGCEVTCSTQNQLVTYCDNQGSKKCWLSSEVRQKLYMPENMKPQAYTKYCSSYGLHTEYYLLFGICGETKRWSTQTLLNAFK